jgi:hypothetical protein
VLTFANLPMRLLLLICGACAGLVNASSLSFSSLQLDDPAFGFGFNDAIVSNATILGAGYTYNYSAELCLSGACSFDAPGSPVTQQLKLSNLSLTCSTSGAETCGPIDVTFDAHYEVSPGSVEQINVSLSNTISPEFFLNGFARICFSDANNICSPSLLGTSSVGIFFSGGSFSGENSGTYSVGGSGPFQVLGLFHIDGLASGDSLSLGHSLDVTSTAIVASDPTPEPSTLLLVPIGIGLLVLGRRRLR